MNIEGKRSGDGFVSDRQRLVGALLRAQAPRIEVLDLTLGRRGFLNYIRLLGGSNIVKIIPSNGSASESQATDRKKLKVICGSHTGYLENESWITQKAEFKRNLDMCQVRVSSNVSVKPNLGAGELAEALSRVIPFTAKEDVRPVLQCVHFVQKKGKLTLAASDGFRLAELSLDFEDGEGQCLIPYDEVMGLIPALKKARRVRLGFEQSETSLDTTNLVVDTEAIRYKYSGHAGVYPDYSKILPDGFVATARIDSREMLKAVSSLGALFLDKDTPIIITLKEGKIRLSVKDDRAEAYIDSQVEGDAEVMISLKFLVQGLKALAGMAELKLTASPTSPVMFNAENYRLAVMPLAPPVSKKAETPTVVSEAEKVVEQAAGKPEVEESPGGEAAEGVAPEEPAEEGITEGEAPEPEPEQEPEPEVEERPKPKRKKKKELVAVG